MAGPAVIDHTRPARRIPEFGTASQADVPAFIGVMGILHREPTSSAFARLLIGSPREEDAVSLAHVFEEISTMALHGLIAEDLLFDAFAFDSYWEQLKGSVEKARASGGNPKFCENFEIAAGLAEAYRESRPPKPRVHN
jgi:hypothetical protein